MKTDLGLLFQSTACREGKVAIDYWFGNDQFHAEISIHEAVLISESLLVAARRAKSLAFRPITPDFPALARGTEKQNSTEPVGRKVSGSFLGSRY